MNTYSPIGMLDSGAGGLSVLREAVSLLPHESFLFYGDQGNAPYGTKSKQEVLALVRRAVGRLMDADVKAIVLACNTATAEAALELRQELSLPVIGMEPALKPASMCYHGGTILVLATPGTLSSAKYAALSSHWGEHAVSVPCPGLMEFVERGELDSPALSAYLERLLAPYRSEQVDAAVLGCTHYVFLKRQISRFFPQGTPVLDGNAGTVRQLKRVLGERGLLNPGPEKGKVLIESSGNAENLRVLEKLFRQNLAMQ